MRDVLHDRGDIDDAVVALQDAEPEIVEIQNFRGVLPRALIFASLPSGVPPPGVTGAAYRLPAKGRTGLLRAALSRAFVSQSPLNDDPFEQDYRLLDKGILIRVSQ